MGEREWIGSGLGGEVKVWRDLGSTDGHGVLGCRAGLLFAGACAKNIERPTQSDQHRATDPQQPTHGDRPTVTNRHRDRPTATKYRPRLTKPEQERPTNSNQPTATNARLSRGLVFDEENVRTRDGLGSKVLPLTKEDYRWADNQGEAEV